MKMQQTNTIESNELDPIRQSVSDLKNQMNQLKINGISTELQKKIDRVYNKYI